MLTINCDISQQREVCSYLNGTVMFMEGIMRLKSFGAILPIALLSYFLILMDNSIVFTSSREIGADLGMTRVGIAWLANAYTLTFGGFLLLAGRLSDLLGRKQIFQIGMAIFGISSFVVGIAMDASTMIIARAAQGIGSAILAPTTLAMMMDAYSGEKRIQAISYYGATAGIGSIIGLLVGGALTSYVSWRAGFLIKLPIIIYLMWLTHHAVAAGIKQKATIDYIGSILSVLGLSSFIYGLTSDFYGGAFVSGGIILLVLFYFYERRFKTPVMPLKLYKNKVRLGAYFVRLLFMMALLPYWFLLPQMLGEKLGYTAFQSGMAFIPVAVFQFVMAMYIPQLTKRFSNGYVLLMGEILLFVGFVMTAMLKINYGYWISVALPMVIIGIGSAMIVAPVTSAGLYKAPNEIAGAASSLTNAMHQLGGPIGLSLIIMMTSTFSSGVYMMAGFTLIATILVAVLIIPNEKD